MSQDAEWIWKRKKKVVPEKKENTQESKNAEKRSEKITSVAQCISELSNKSPQGPIFECVLWISISITLLGFGMFRIVTCDLCVSFGINGTPIVWGKIREKTHRVPKWKNEVLGTPFPVHGSWLKSMSMLYVLHYEPLLF